MLPKTSKRSIISVLCVAWKAVNIRSARRPELTEKEEGISIEWTQWSNMTEMRKITKATAQSYYKKVFGHYRV